MNETQFQQTVIDLAHLTGWRVAHFRGVRVQRKDGSIYYQTPVQADGTGFPDLVMARDDRTLYAEIKVTPNKPSAEQWEWLRALQANPSNEVYLWYPEDWEEIETVLQSKHIQRFEVKEISNAATVR